MTNNSEQEFLQALAHYSIYWANLPSERLYTVGKETESEARTNGLIHSILCLLNGDSSANDFKEYTLKLGRTKIGADIYLPTEYFKVFRKIKGDYNE